MNSGKPIFTAFPTLPHQPTHFYIPNHLINTLPSYPTFFHHQSMPSQCNYSLFANQTPLNNYHQTLPSYSPPCAKEDEDVKDLEQQLDGNSNIPSENFQETTTKKKKASKGSKKQNSTDEYLPEEEGNFPTKAYKPSETKNIPKNFGKAILRFIRKNESMAFQFLTDQGYNFKKFHMMLSSYKDKINTIAELRSLWVDEDNQFAKGLRVLSMLYLRKHNLRHIFNSRVENHSRHLKYRQKIMKALENPKQFTCIKDF